MKKYNSILLIDDDIITQFINKKLILKMEICNTIELANNGKEALRYLNSIDVDKFPDLILLDINMPVMNGFEFLETFSILYPVSVKEIKIYILTTSTSQKDIKKMDEFEFVLGLLNKPLTKEKLLKEIIG